MSKKKRIILIILSIIVIGLLSFAIYIQFFKNNDKGENKAESEILNIETKLYQDFVNKKITTDEYVKYSLYSEFNQERLPEEYKEYSISESSNANELLLRYGDEVSKETLQYYFDKTSLKDVSFKLDKENSTSNNYSSYLITSVKANSEKVTNLNKAVISDNKRFVVWYTTTGDSAIDKETAKKVANDLEKTTIKYDNIYSTTYTFDSNYLIHWDTNKHQDQVDVLKSCGIDDIYLDLAMQVYMYNYSDDGSLAMYTAIQGSLVGLINGIDSNGSLLYPYIRIKPSAFSDHERLEQLANHELFHHYHHYVLCEKDYCDLDENAYSAESMANFSSALATNKTTDYGFLNGWAGNYKEYSNSFFDKLVPRAAKEEISPDYAFYVYLYNFYQLKGINDIKNGLYESDFFSYLHNHSSIEERKTIQKNIAIKNLTYDYDNKNLNVSPERRNYTINAVNRIFFKDSSYEGDEIENIFKLPKKYDVKLDRNGIYYVVIDTSKNKTINFNFSGNSEIGTLLLAEDNGKIETITEDSNYSVNGHDKYYYIVYNTSLINTNDFSIDISDSDKAESKTDVNKNATLSTHLGCVNFSKGICSNVQGHLMDENGKSYGLTIAIGFCSDGLDKVEPFYNKLKQNKNYKDVEYYNEDHSVITFSYTDEAYKKYFGNLTELELSKLYIEQNDKCDDNSPDFFSDNSSSSNNKTSASKVISYENCDALYNEDIELAVDTFYYKNDEAYKELKTVYYYSAEDAKDSYDFYSEYPDKYTNVKLVKNKILQYELTDSMFNRIYTTKTREQIDYNYKSSCSLQCDGDDCEWTHTDNTTKSSFDPNNP